MNLWLFYSVCQPDGAALQMQYSLVKLEIMATALTQVNVFNTSEQQGLCWRHLSCRVLQNTIKVSILICQKMRQYCFQSDWQSLTTVDWIKHWILQERKTTNENLNVFFLDQNILNREYVEAFELNYVSFAIYISSCQTRGFRVT